MRSVPVVVVDVLGDEPVELMLVPDDRAVEQLASERPDPSFREAVGHRRTHRGGEDLHAFVAEDGVEGPGELAPTVADQRLRVGGLSRRGS